MRAVLAFLEGGFARQRHVAALIAGLHKTAFSATKADDSDRVLNEELSAPDEWWAAAPPPLPLEGRRPLHPVRP